ncbi:hypothetical protein G4V62_07495 [Bacillaceae bacterium SIJ1]|nr:hypothetical protein [Litoribacterium kuwaitense]NGP44809.1 hypothetical protein [Litoribacterium kuwaitense]
MKLSFQPLFLYDGKWFNRRVAIKLNDEPISLGLVKTLHAQIIYSLLI